MLRKILYALSAACILFTFSCRKDSIGVNTNEEFILSYKQTAVVTDPATGENVSIKFNELLSESRCPVGVNCVWQGEVSIGVQVDKNEKIAIGLTDTIAVAKSFKLLLLEVNPYPVYQKQVSEKEYKAVMKVVR